MKETDLSIDTLKELKKCMLRELDLNLSKSLESLELSKTQAQNYFRSLHWIKDVTFELNYQNLAGFGVENHFPPSQEWSLTTFIPSFVFVHLIGQGLSVFTFSEPSNLEPPKQVRLNAVNGNICLHSTSTQALLQYIKENNIQFTANKDIVELYSLAKKDNS